MDPVNPAVGLYDFLYRDAARLTSYFAQVYGGRLSSKETVDSSREGRERTGRLGAPLVTLGGDAKAMEEQTRSTRETFDPHDLSITNLLTLLLDERYTYTSVNDTPPGQILSARGTVYFVDRNLASLDALENEAHEQLPPGLAIPSAFLLRQADTHNLVGTIKEAGMEESIISYYLKHGAGGVPDVYLIGIREANTSNAPPFPAPLFKVAHGKAKLLGDLMFPSGSIRVTPLVIFRKIEPRPEPRLTAAT